MDANRLDIFTSMLFFIFFLTSEEIFPVLHLLNWSVEDDSVPWQSKAYTHTDGKYLISLVRVLEQIWACRWIHSAVFRLLFFCLFDRLNKCILINWLIFVFKLYLNTVDWVNWAYCTFHCCLIHSPAQRIYTELQVQALYQYLHLFNELRKQWCALQLDLCTEA